MKPANGVFQVHAVPVPAPVANEALRLEDRYSEGSLTGTVIERTFTVGDRSMSLSQASRVFLRPAPHVALWDGTAVEGAVSGLSAVPVTLGGRSLKLNLAEAL